jgi:hypothetical protein
VSIVGLCLWALIKSGAVYGEYGIIWDRTILLAASQFTAQPASFSTSWPQSPTARLRERWIERKERERDGERQERELVIADSLA